MREVVRPPPQNLKRSPGQILPRRWRAGQLRLRHLGEQDK